MDFIGAALGCVPVYSNLTTRKKSVTSELWTLLLFGVWPSLHNNKHPGALAVCRLFSD